MAASYVFSNAMPEPRPEREIPRDIVAEPVFGWRMWYVQRPTSLTLNAAMADELADRFDRGDNPFRGLFGARLHGVGNGHAWNQRDLTAVCTRASTSATLYYSISTYATSTYVTNPTVPVPGPAAHDAPHQNCTCGVWALKDSADLWRTLDTYDTARPQTFAYGRVQMWGRIFEHAKGWRAEHARPYEVFVVNGDEKQVAELRDFYRCDVQASETPAAMVEARAERKLREQEAALQQARYSVDFANQLSGQSYARLSLEPPPKTRRVRKGKP